MSMPQPDKMSDSTLSHLHLCGHRPSFESPMGCPNKPNKRACIYQSTAYKKEHITKTRTWTYKYIRNFSGSQNCELRPLLTKTGTAKEEGDQIIWQGMVSYKFPTVRCLKGEKSSSVWNRVCEALHAGKWHFSDKNNCFPGCNGTFLVKQSSGKIRVPSNRKQTCIVQLVSTDKEMMIKAMFEDVTIERGKSNKCKGRSIYVEGQWKKINIHK